MVTLFPTETYDEQDNVTTAINKVLHRWKINFAHLFQNNGNCDYEFLRNIKSKVIEFENEQRNIIGDNNTDIDVNIINKVITDDEVRLAVLKAKLGKAIRVDIMSYYGLF